MHCKSTAYSFIDLMPREQSTDQTLPIYLIYVCEIQRTAVVAAAAASSTPHSHIVTDITSSFQLY